MNRWVRVSFALLVGASAMGACTVDRADTTSAACTGLSCRDVMSDGTVDVGGVAAGPDASVAPLLPLLKVVCGPGSCVPDDPRACASYSPPPPVPVSGGDTNQDAGAGSAALDAGSDGLDGGLNDGGHETEVDGSFSRPTPPEAAPSAFACQLTGRDSNDVARSCAPAGTRQTDEACTSSLDCAPGLGCVGSVRSGRCLPFCCGLGEDTCGEGHYCAQRPLRSTELGEADGPLVPVCDRAENCSLGEPADCTGQYCVCAMGTACSVVRTDGTTACVPEGFGVAGGACPCKWGYHCSQATMPATCVKTCELNIANSCGVGLCQATPLLPEGWGTCVGASPDQMP